MKVSVSYLKSKFNRKTTILKIENSSADYLHVDLMDGKYVDTKNFTIGEVINDLKSVHLPLDIHLMVKNPEKYIEKLGMLNTEFITIHLDSTKNPKKVIELIKSIGCRVGVAINPNEDISILSDYLHDIDLVLIMSVVPGKGGQTFMPHVLEKVDNLNKKDLLISIDGGVNNETVELIKERDIDIVVSGSYVCSTDNFNDQIKLLK